MNRRPGDLALERARNLEAWIDAHLGEPITMGTLCRVAGVGERCLQKSFLYRRGDFSDALRRRAPAAGGPSMAGRCLERRDGDRGRIALRLFAPGPVLGVLSRGDRRVTVADAGGRKADGMSLIGEGTERIRARRSPT
ncbi:MAG: hypothetical protein MZV63_27030 [Marinilabiliales bacterium]|nr:hypothetical protein [Marinilabiliales bacterium]